ncbi:M23 family metallopeptidase, partial [Patescibacteria group bacterium]|nr:M23 family metallopeptidase [Patescibacteria group bacterium]
MRNYNHLKHENTDIDKVDLQSGLYLSDKAKNLSMIVATSVLALLGCKSNENCDPKNNANVSVYNINADDLSGESAMVKDENQPQVKVPVSNSMKIDEKDDPKLVEINEKNTFKVYGNLKDVLDKTIFPKGTFTNFVKTFQGIFAGKFNEAHYFNADGELLKSVELPNDFAQLPEGQKQKFHNEVRKSLNFKSDAVLPQDIAYSGYPFVAVSKRGPDAANLGSTMLQVVENRLKQKLRDVRYFDNVRTPLTEAIRKIAAAYNVPSDLALAVAAQESTYYKGEKSNVNAIGIFQLQFGKHQSGEEAYSSMKNIIPGVRDFHKDEILLKKDKYNRFVQIELFCSYYKILEKRLSDNADKLNQRIQKIDSDYKAFDKNLIYIAAFNAGHKRIKDAIDAFVQLDDATIKSKLGDPPYDFNVISGVLFNAYGGVNKVGSHVLFYTPKVIAWRDLLNNDGIKVFDNKNIPVGLPGLMPSYVPIKLKDKHKYNFSEWEDRGGVAYPIMDIHKIGKVRITGGFMERRGHGRKQKDYPVIFENGVVEYIGPKTSGDTNFNIGIDYFVLNPNRQVKAWYGGDVVFAGKDRHYGKRVIVKTDIKFTHDGHKYDVYQAYSHLARTNVKKGDQVGQSESVGVMGGSGKRMNS